MVASACCNWHDVAYRFGWIGRLCRCQAGKTQQRRSCLKKGASLHGVVSVDRDDFIAPANLLHLEKAVAGRSGLELPWLRIQGKCFSSRISRTSTSTTSASRGAARGSEAGEKLPEEKR